MATTSTQRNNWVSAWRLQINALILAAEALKALNDEFVAGNFTANLVDGDMATGTPNQGILAGDIKSSVTNGLLMAQAVTDNLGHTIAPGASTTIYAIK
jgi:hypothetical protein